MRHRLGPLLPLGAVLLLVAAGAIATSALPHPDRASPAHAGAETVAAVSGATLVCPELTAGPQRASRLAVAALPAGLVEPQPVGGSAVAYELGSGREERLRVDVPGELAYADARPGSDRAVVVVGSGSFAAGVAAGQTTRIPQGDDRGLAGTPCVRPGADAWFVGAGAAPGRRGRLYLVNEASTPARVDVTLFGERGPVPAPAAARLALAPGARRVLLLDALAPGEPTLAVRVSARSGRVAAALRDRQVAGLTPLGLDWLPPAAAPARRVDLPPVPAGSGPLALTLVAPGERQASARLTLLGPAGPLGGVRVPPVAVPARSVRRVDLSAVAGRGPVAVVVEADEPVSAGLELRRTGRDGVGDIGFLAAAAPLDGPGLLPYADSSVPGTRTTLLLAAPRAGSLVRVLTLRPGANPAPAEVTVQVPAGAAVVADLPPFPADARREGFAVAVVPAQAGRVLAAALVDETGASAPFFTLASAVPARGPVPLPAVRADLTAGLPAR